MSYGTEMEKLMEGADYIIDNLETRKIRALACQYKMVDWKTESIAKLRRQLIELSQTVDVLGGDHA